MRRLVKKALNICLNYAGFPLLSRKYGRNAVTAIMYHRVIDSQKFFYKGIIVKKREFEKQMEYLARYYNVISIDTFYKLLSTKAEITKNTVLLTFDDGYMDNLEIAYPIMKYYEFPFTIFLTTACVNTDEPTSLLWPDKLGYILTEKKTAEFSIEEIGDFELTPENYEAVFFRIANTLKKFDYKSRDKKIEKLRIQLGVEIDPEFVMQTMCSWKAFQKIQADSDLMTVCPHTHNHCILERETPNTQKAQIVKSAQMIKKYLKTSKPYFCYPNGNPEDYNKTTIDILHELNFKMAFTTIAGTNDPSTPLFELRRIASSYHDNMYDFKAKLFGMEEIYSQVK